MTPPEGRGKEAEGVPAASELRTSPGGWKCGAEQVSRQKAAVAVPSWANGRTLPISSYVDVSAGWSRGVHASARPERFSQPAQPYQRAPPSNSDRNRDGGLAGSGEMVAPIGAKRGGNCGGLSSGTQPTFVKQVQTLLRQESVGVGKEQPLAQKEMPIPGALGETP